MSKDSPRGLIESFRGACINISIIGMLICCKTLLSYNNTGLCRIKIRPIALNTEDMG